MIYFISGHRDISDSEFKEHYEKRIDEILTDDPSALFVVGDYEGVDIMAQNYLVGKGCENKITVYHMFVLPRNINPQITKIKGGYSSDEERDSAMTRESDIDLAWVRQGKEKSGTAQNLMRRKKGK